MEDDELETVIHVVLFTGLYFALYDKAPVEVHTNVAPVVVIEFVIKPDGTLQMVVVVGVVVVGVVVVIVVVVVVTGSTPPIEESSDARDPFR
jgi:hypothetical protein